MDALDQYMQNEYMKHYRQGYRAGLEDAMEAIDSLRSKYHGSLSDDHLEAMGLIDALIENHSRSPLTKPDIPLP